MIGVISLLDEVSRTRMPFCDPPASWTRVPASYAGTGGAARRRAGGRARRRRGRGQAGAEIGLAGVLSDALLYRRSGGDPVSTIISVTSGPLGKSKSHFLLTAMLIPIVPPWRPPWAAVVGVDVNDEDSVLAGGFRRSTPGFGIGCRFGSTFRHTCRRCVATAATAAAARVR